MSNTYRHSRNIEASIIDYLKVEFQEDWSSDRVEMTFARIYEIELPSICVRVGTTIHEKVEIGGDATRRTPQVLIDIFATGDGQREDIKDWLITKIKNGFIYYEYEIEARVVKTKTANGRIRVLDIYDVPLNFTTDKEKLDPHDRYRHLLTLSVSLGKVEA